MTSTHHYVADLFDAVDTLDATAFADRFTKDVSLRIGYAWSMFGAQPIAKTASASFGTISSLKHEILSAWSGAREGGAVTSVKTTVTYRRKDVTATDAIPVTSTLRVRG